MSARIFGPLGERVARLALDTGATGSTINLAILASLGYDVTAEGTALRIITGSGTVHAPRIAVDRLAALGQVRQQFPVLGHTLPAGTNVDGVLGLDFLRGQRLEVDFRAGFVTLD